MIDRRDDPESCCEPCHRWWGPSHVSTDPDVLAGRSVDHTGRYRGHASALVRPGSADEVAEVLRPAATRACTSRSRAAGHRWSPAPSPNTTTCCCPPERLSGIGEVDTVERGSTSAPGRRWPTVQRAATAAGLVFGVDLAARDSATVGGMASTNAGGLRTVRYGNMGEQVIGLDVALPDGSVVRRHSEVRRDNTGYDLAALFVGAEGTLGVITALDLRLHPTPRTG